MFHVLYCIRLVPFMDKMNENIFDSITEKNASRKKDCDRSKDKEKLPKSHKNEKPKPSEAAKDAAGGSATAPGGAPAGLEKLGEYMQNGFELMRQSLDKFGKTVTDTIRDELSSIPYDYFDCDGEADDVDLEDYGEDGNIFTEISNEVSGEAAGPELNPPLAKLVNKLVSTRMTDDRTKEKEQQYNVPKNIQFAVAPKVHKPIWESMRPSTRSLDGKLQNVQKSILKSALPVAKVMEELFDNRETPGQLDVNALITTLADALNFVGSANVGLNKTRKAAIKSDLPNNMQDLCLETEEVSATFLFGDNLNARIKEVAELNRVKRTISSADKGRKGFMRGRFRGRFRASPRGHWGRMNRRYTPYLSPSFTAPKNSNKSGSSSRA